MAEAENERHVPFYAIDDLNIDYDALDSEEEGDAVTNEETDEQAPNLLNAQGIVFHENEDDTEEQIDQSNEPTESRRSPPAPPPGPSATGSSRTLSIAPSSNHNKRVVFNGMVSVAQPLPENVFFDID